MGSAHCLDLPIQKLTHEIPTPTVVFITKMIHTEYVASKSITQQADPFEKHTPCERLILNRLQGVYRFLME